MAQERVSARAFDPAQIPQLTHAYMLQYIPIPFQRRKMIGKTGTPAYWHWNDANETTIVLLDSGYFPLQRFKITDQFKEQLDGRYRRTPAQAHRHPSQASGPGYPRAGSTYTRFSSPVTWAELTEPDPFPIPNAGIRTGEIVAYRAWLYHGRGYLRSMYRSGTIWKPGEIMTGDPDAHFNPMLGHCQGGVHAFKNEVDRMCYCISYRQQREQHRMTYALTPEQQERYYIVTGTVELWGTVVEHARGYRASHAAIASLDHVAALSDMEIEALCGMYGVPRNE